jgi:hypothetical protein
MVHRQERLYWYVINHTVEAHTTGVSNAPCPTDSGKVAFNVIDTSWSTNSKCLEPNPILYGPPVICPCPNPDEICVRPLQSERIMQIQFDTGKVVLWQGDRTLILRDIKVGKQGARFLGPVVRWGTIFIE